MAVFRPLVSKGCLGAGLAFALAAGVETKASADVWRQPLSIEAGLPVVDVWIRTRGPYRFLLDTGAEGTTVSRQLAEDLALAVVGAVEQHTVNGVSRVPMARVPEMQIGRGGPLAQDVAVAISDLAGPRAALQDLDGVVGGDLLDGHDYLVDYGDGQLVVARGESLPVRGGVELPLVIDRQRPLVRWPSAGLGAAFGSTLLLLLDSGADALIVDSSSGAFTCRPRTERRMTLDTQAGRRDITACEAEPLLVGGVSIRGLRLVEVAWLTAVPRRERGLLPASAFARVYVSPSRGTVTFWPR